PAEEVRKVELGGGSGLDAHRRPIQLLRRGHAERFFHHEALAVVEVDASEAQSQRAVAGHRPGGVADENVRLTGLQSSEPLLSGCRNILDLVRVTQDGSGNRLAVVDVEAGPVALVIGVRETGEPDVNSAVQNTALFYLIECLGGGCAGSDDSQHGDHSKLDKPFHYFPP